MREHPIQGLMNTAMENIREMVDVNTIIGNPVTAPDGTVIIPVSKVAFGFAAGGGEYGGELDFTEAEEVTLKSDTGDEQGYVIPEVKYPFAGGSGAGVSLTPVAFLVVNGSNIKLLSVDHNTTIEKLVDMIPGFFNKICDTIKNKSNNASDSGQNDNMSGDYTEAEAF